MGGKACIRGMRITVRMIDGQVGAGRTIDDLITVDPGRIRLTLWPLRSSKF